MRAVLMLVAVAVLAAGCGGSRSERSPADVFAAWVRALEQRDVERVLELVDPRLRAQLPEGRQREFVGVMRDRAAGAADGEPVLVTEIGSYAVVAARKETDPGAYAAVLGEVGDGWRVMGPGADIVYGRPAGAAGDTTGAEVTFSVIGRVAPHAVTLWVDDEPLDARATGSTSSKHEYEAALPDLAPGTHVITVYATTAARGPHAIAWTFTVR